MVGCSLSLESGVADRSGRRRVLLLPLGLGRGSCGSPALALAAGGSLGVFLLLAGFRSAEDLEQVFY